MPAILSEAIMHKTSIQTIIGFLAVFAAVATLSACNTTAGAGKDVSAVGHAVTHEADKDK